MISCICSITIHLVLVFQRGSDGVPSDVFQETVPEVIREFVSSGLRANPELRATVEELLSHPALRLLGMYI